MAWTVRIVAAVLLAAIMFVMNKVAHLAVEAGFLAWLALMAGIFWLAFAIENKDRAAEERPRYSWRDARELIPIGIGAIGLILAMLVYSYGSHEIGGVLIFVAFGSWVGWNAYEVRKERQRADH